MDAEKQFMRPGLSGWARGEAGEPFCWECHPPAVLLCLEGIQRHRVFLSEGEGGAAERNPPPLK